MIFLDTSAIYALADGSDSNHQTAVRHFQEILDRGEDVLTHNYVLLESISLIQARLGLLAAAKLARESQAFVVEWVDKDLHASGTRELEKSQKRKVSLVDHISFLVMRRRGVKVVFAFDPDFKTEGFQLFGI